MKFKRIPLFFALLTCIHNVHAFTYELIVAMINKKNLLMSVDGASDCKITFFSDHHKKSPLEQEQIESLIRYLQEQKDTQSFHMLVEEASEFCKKDVSGYEVLYTLSKHIKEELPSLAHVTLDNIEVRHISSLAWNIFVHYELYNQYRNYKLNDNGKTIGTITFQDVLDEFDHIRQSLADYYFNHPNQAIAAIYADSMQAAEKHYEGFKYKISNPNQTVLAYVKAQQAKKSLYYNNHASQVLHEQQNDRPIVATDIKLNYMHLFDLNLLKNILMSDSPNILVFAGGDHTHAVMSMLSKLNATTIFHENNAIIKPISQINGFTRSEEIVSPVTGQQIIQALSAQPKPTETRYAPTMCYTAIAAAVLYYLWFVCMSEQIYGQA